MNRTLIAALLLLLATPAAADTLRVIGAGSLTDAFSDLLHRFPVRPDTVETPEFGPSGLMRAGIEAGKLADLFASADMDQARRLAVGHPERSVIMFTRNRLCAIARPGIGLTQANMLDKLLDPAVRIATSTPGADPGGDYAWAVFARADAIHPGARATLEAKAQKLVGGGDKTPLLVPGKGAVAGVFIADRADIMLGYCSGAPAVIGAVPNLTSVPLPTDLSVGPAYGMVLLNTKPVTLRFAAFVMSEPGQAVLQTHGFDPVALSAPAPASHAVLIERAGQPPKLLTPEHVAGLKPITQRVSFTSEHGEQQNEWSGPLLWDVLTDAGAIDPAKPADEVHMIVRVTGADGYAATFAAGEFAPEFANHPIQLADHMNGAALPNQSLRLVVPGDKRGGRSVRDVVRIDIE